MHTLVSQHAFSTVNELVMSAKEKGLKAIAITDHGPNMPDGAKPVHFRAFMHSIPDEICGIRVYKGSEVNIIDYEGRLDLSEKILSSLDFVIASYHIESITPHDSKAHTEGLIKVIENPNVDCLGHTGNPIFLCNIERIVSECKKHNKLIEINSSSFAVRKGSYPICREIACLCKKHLLNIVVNSDAHSLYNVGEHTAALNMLEDIGFPEELVINSSYERLLKYFEAKHK